MKRRLFLSGIIGAAAAAPALSRGIDLSLSSSGAEDELMEYKLELIIDGASVFKHAVRRVRANICEYGNTKFNIVDDERPLFEIYIDRRTTAVGAWMRMPERFVKAGYYEWTRLGATQNMPIELIPGDELVVNKT